MLHFAVFTDQLDCVKILLEHPEINVNAKVVKCKYVSSELLPAIGSTAIICAVQRDNLEMIQMLIGHPKIDVNLRDIYGKCALRAAADRGIPEIIRILLNFTEEESLEPVF